MKEPKLADNEDITRVYDEMVEKNPTLYMFLKQQTRATREVVKQTFIVAFIKGQSDAIRFTTEMARYVK